MPKIEQREPPARMASGSRRPIMPLDADIMALADERALRPVTIAEALRHGNHPGVTTQRVVSRLKALTTRGLMVRIRPAEGPANGPGTSLYRVKRAGDDED